VILDVANEEIAKEIQEEEDYCNILSEMQQIVEEAAHVDKHVEKNNAENEPPKPSKSNDIIDEVDDDLDVQYFDPAIPLHDVLITQ
jgi:hypothetical protein